MEHSHDTNEKGFQQNSGLKPEVPNEQPEKQTQAPKLDKNQAVQPTGERKQIGNRKEEEEKNKNADSNLHAMKSGNKPHQEQERNDQKKAV